jgi:hypothetical protein
MAFDPNLKRQGSKNYHLLGTTETIHTIEVAIPGKSTPNQLPTNSFIIFLA